IQQRALGDAGRRLLRRRLRLSLRTPEGTSPSSTVSPHRPHASAEPARSPEARRTSASRSCAGQPHDAAPILSSVDLRQLEIFVKVAELGSFSKAAEALYLTQPTISEHIRTLEDELGVRLLDRLGRGAAVTRAGQLLLSYAGRMLALS